MNLFRVLQQADVKYHVSQGSDLIDGIKIDDIATDSRLVKKSSGSVFFALKGKEVNGEEYIPSAISSGAKVIIAKNYSKIDDPGIIFITCEKPFKILTKFLSIFYSQLPQNIFAVTGTNGKTSVVEFVRQIFDLAGVKAASIGTLGLNCNHVEENSTISSPLTTPDIVGLYKNLSILKKNEVDNVAIEASSIGLDQNRMAGLRIKNAAFTNFSQDHLDYHQNMDEYFATKATLFSDLILKGSNVALNADIDQFSELKEICQKNNHKIIDYGQNAEVLKLICVNEKNNGQEIEISYQGSNYKFFININVNFQIFNLICALGIVFGHLKLDHEKILDLVKKFDQLQSATGRMQEVANYNDAQIFIDYAHTPDALEISLRNARKLNPKRLIALFGCGGDRDHSKRSIMGKVASDYCDLAIVTDDNPRNEDPAKIRVEILQSCNMEKTIEIDGRKNAIEKSLQMLKKGDIIILAGKGHEKHQSIKGKKIDFDELKIINDFIAKN